MESRRITAGMGLLFTALGAWIAFEIAADWPGYLAAGATGFGTGGQLFQPGCEITALRKQAERYMAALRQSS